MLWVLSLHIMSLLVWTAAALYVAIVLMTHARQQLAPPPMQEDLQAQAETGEAGFTHAPSSVDSIARFVFTHVASPAAIISITAGSAVFLLNQSHHFWLLAKLTLVTFLCITQALMGLIIIRAERGKFKHMVLYCRAFLLVLCVLMVAIVWIVLGKPATPVWVEQWI